VWLEECTSRVCEAREQWEPRDTADGAIGLAAAATAVARKNHGGGGGGGGGGGDGSGGGGGGGGGGGVSGLFGSIVGGSSGERRGCGRGAPETSVAGRVRRRMALCTRDVLARTLKAIGILEAPEE